MKCKSGQRTSNMDMQKGTVLNTEDTKGLIQLLALNCLVSFKKAKGT